VIILASLENNDPSGVMLLGKRCPGQAVASRNDGWADGVNLKKDGGN